MSSSEIDSGRQATASDLTFLFVGGQRCGSTWMYEALKEHPEIYLPASKQTHFFDESYHNGMDWYLKHFDKLQHQHKAVGEVATGYCLPGALRNVHAEYPDIRIIMAMRNPTERANSYYRSRAPHEGWKNLDEALVDDPAIVTRGQYADQVEVLLNLFDREKVLLLFFDDLRKDEVKYIETVYAFLGVDTSFRPSVIGSSVRAAMFPNARRFLKRMGLNFIVNIVNRSWLGDLMRRYTRKKRRVTDASKKMPEETRQRLIEHFTPYNQRLGSLLDRDLENWNN